MKILYVNFTMNIGGIESFLMNLVRNMDLKENDISFLCYKNEIFDYEKEIKFLGLNIIKISDPMNVSIHKHMKELNKVIKNGNYDVIHCNTYFDSAFVMYVAYKNGIKVRVTHSHTSQGFYPKNNIQKIKWNIARKLINKYSTTKIACSTEAGKSLFSNNNFEIIENGVSIEKFIYDETIKKNLRDKYNLPSDALVIGHVGRFVKVKNHEFILNIMKELLKNSNNYYLTLVGDGPEYNYIRKMAKKMKIDKHIIFTGNINNVNDYYNLMDIMIFPSFYEGLPVALIEAQINGLNIVSSDKVPKEINIVDNVMFLSLDDDIINWVEAINNNIGKRNIRKNYFINSKYNINNTIKKIIDIYNK